MTASKGYALILATALISGFSIWINDYGVKGFNPYLFTTIKNVLVAIALSVVLLLAKECKKLLSLKRKAWAKLALVGLIGGAIPFLLFFEGLKISSGANSGFIHKTMFIYVWALSPSLLNKKKSIYTLLLFAGAVLLLGLNPAQFNNGDALVLLATLLWSAEILLSKKLLKELPGNIVAWARMAIGSIFLLAFSGVNGLLTQALTFSLTQWSWIGITSALLFAYVITFYNGLKTVNAVDATSLLLIGSVITSLLSLFNGKALLITQYLGLVMIIAVTCLLSGSHDHENQAVA